MLRTTLFDDLSNNYVHRCSSVLLLPLFAPLLLMLLRSGTRASGYGMGIGFHFSDKLGMGWLGGSVAEWLACWTQTQKGLGSNRSRDALG